MPDTAHFLDRIFSPDHFSKEELALIRSQYTQVHFKKQDYLLREGRTAQHYWFVERGFIRSFAIDTRGNDISTNFYTTGNIAIDWPSFFLRSPTRENMQALTDCTCWQLGFERFQSLFHSIERFREQGRTTLVGSYFELKNRSISMIADPAKDRYKRLLEEKPHILQNVSLKQIATYLGITDTSLSRIRKELAQEQ
ncbi:Crp/Fnr family transcriptional regulator [Taibaiella koreensis]|uniref:Crp/Fnr family transcriptional regulator n=1 Tax=Taibaiella koreensis TaxID=1268548 RepID=UPI000E59E7A1|nr:Crp/Fnr family transcriptional regulator [Taibaiella koreensis]